MKQFFLKLSLNHSKHAIETSRVYSFLKVNALKKRLISMKNLFLWPGLQFYKWQYIKKYKKTNINKTNCFYVLSTRWTGRACLRTLCLPPSLSSSPAHPGPSTGSTRVCRKAFWCLWIIIKLKKDLIKIFYLVQKVKQ